jgi:hypothetical protein
MNHVLHDIDLLRESFSFMRYVERLIKIAGLTKSTEVSAIFTGRMQTWVCFCWQMDLQILTIISVSMGRRIYFDLCVNLHRIETVSA